VWPYQYENILSRDTEEAQNTVGRMGEHLLPLRERHSRDLYMEGSSVETHVPKSMPPYPRFPWIKTDE
jgi:hypothetical protein